MPHAIWLTAKFRYLHSPAWNSPEINEVRKKCSQSMQHEIHLSTPACGKMIACQRERARSVFLCILVEKGFDTTVQF